MIYVLTIFARKFRSRSGPVMGLTVIIPAYNEAEFVGDTIRSLLAQSVPPDQIILVDDGSTDSTGDVGRRAGITVIRPPRNTGSKAGAQTFALPWVQPSS